MKSSIKRKINFRRSSSFRKSSIRNITIKILFDIIVGVGIVMLTACASNGVFRDRIDDYKLVNECPSLRIPTGVAAEPRSEDYYIPEKDGKSFRISQHAASNHPTSPTPFEGKMNTKKLALDIIKDGKGAQNETFQKYDPLERVVKTPNAVHTMQLPKLPADRDSNTHDSSGDTISKR